MRFEILGPIRVWHDDTELDPGSPQQRAVLAILLLSQGRQVPRDVLIDAIWGDSPPRTAAGTVRTYISRLRQCLDPVTGYRAVELLETAVFGGVRRLLHDELGIDPGPGLRTMHERILRMDDSLIPPADGDDLAVAGTARPVAPLAQLPPVHAGWTGRADTLDAIVAALSNRSAPVVAITGMPGIGKTALAVQAAHAARAAFPGGQLYLELGNADGSPVDPREVLTRLSGTLGKSLLPGPLEGALAGRRMLAVLDGVRDAAQAHPLLDALRGCAVIVTTQRRMIDLPGARWFEVDPLPLAEAMHLLESLIGQERVAADREGAELLSVLSAGQPIALRTAAARLVARPAWKITAMARQLAEELSGPVITHADCYQVEAPFELAYQQLTEEQAFVFRQAGMNDCLKISVAAVAALTGMSEHRAFALLESIADVHLIQADVFGSYLYDPLVKLFAKRRALAEDGPQLCEATYEVLSGLKP